MEKHITALSVLYIALGVLGLLIAGVVFFSVAGAGWISGDADAIAITTGVGTLIAAFFVILAVPAFIAGWGLSRCAPWARILALVLGALNLLNIPFGTALAVYTFWVLLNDRTTPLFVRQAGA